MQAATVSFARRSGVDALVPALLGPTIIGLIVGAHHGPVESLRAALAMPAVVLCVTAIMLPALYIGMSLAPEAPSAAELGRSVLGGLRSSGIAALGMCIPTAFLLTTTRSSSLAAGLGAATLAGSLLCGLRVLRDEILGENAQAASWIFGLWACTAMGIGARLYIDAIVKGA